MGGSVTGPSPFRDWFARLLGWPPSKRPGPYSSAWGAIRGSRPTGKDRLSRTRERAQMRRAKMRGRRGADKMRLRGGTIDAAGGLFGFAWWVDTPRVQWADAGWLEDITAPDALVWKAATSHGYDEEVAACLYCRGVSECEFHPFPF